MAVSKFSIEVKEPIFKTDNESLYLFFSKMQEKKEFYFAIREKEWYDDTEKPPGRPSRQKGCLRQTILIKERKPAL